MRSTKGCKKSPAVSYIKDRYDVAFPVKNHCEECYNVIYNSLPQLLFGQAEELKHMKFQAYRLTFTTENKQEVEKVLQLCENSFVREAKINIKDSFGGEFTYGHYKRGVE